MKGLGFRGLGVKGLSYWFLVGNKGIYSVGIIQEKYSPIPTKKPASLGLGVANADGA